MDKTAAAIAVGSHRNEQRGREGGKGQHTHLALHGWSCVCVCVCVQIGCYASSYEMAQLSAPKLAAAAVYAATEMRLGSDADTTHAVVSAGEREAVNSLFQSQYIMCVSAGGRTAGHQPLRCR